MKTSTVRAWSWAHKWTSLVCTLFLLMLCVTGLPLIFTHEIEHALEQEHWTPANPDGPMLPLDRVLDIALADRPGELPIFMSFDEDRPVVNVTTAPSVDSPGSQMHFAPYDRTSGELAPQVGGNAVLEFLLQLHTDMFAGLPGMLFLGLMGLLFAVSIVSGVVLYAPFMRRLPFGAVRTARSRRVRWLDYHNLLGVIAVAWMLVVGLTGVVNTLADPIISYWKTDRLGRLTAAYASKDPAVARSSLDDAVAKAQQALPGMQLQFVAFPGGAYSTDHHYAVFFHGDTPVTKHLITPALMDAQTGELTAAEPMPWYAKTLSLSQPLHFGDYGGLPLKILWALLDLATIAILVTGVYLWLSRRRQPRTARDDQPLLASEP
ncbi:PepSY domain-containing protein [Brevundimonas sp. PAMC22021]|uniref:PepSY-associated TM helix domain-containing protein n=1 Tax=Brevundimonas sp. PAMC22021 TaxID=2861285 RepID=UPI00210502FE|nr:PepSY domain-containing protein [Brevundimonas sp. PAMC22021]